MDTTIPVFMHTPPPDIHFREYAEPPPVRTFILPRLPIVTMFLEALGLSEDVNQSRSQPTGDHQGPEGRLADTYAMPPANVQVQPANQIHIPVEIGLMILKEVFQDTKTSWKSMSTEERHYALQLRALNKLYIDLLPPFPFTALEINQAQFLQLLEDVADTQSALCRSECDTHDFLHLLALKVSLDDETTLLSHTTLAVRALQKMTKLQELQIVFMDRACNNAFAYMAKWFGESGAASHIQKLHLLDGRLERIYGVGTTQPWSDSDEFIPCLQVFKSLKTLVIQSYDTAFYASLPLFESIESFMRLISSCPPIRKVMEGMFVLQILRAVSTLQRVYLISFRGSGNQVTIGYWTTREKERVSDNTLHTDAVSRMKQPDVQQQSYDESIFTRIFGVPKSGPEEGGEDWDDPLFMVFSDILGVPRMPQQPQQCPPRDEYEKLLRDMNTDIIVLRRSGSHNFKFLF
ncbi:hypothetical protein NM688_g8469 [Phlebia brevispora]|uniref:Uncharacterized protein n=1 Tax=Phlebia brevispora TaxID=194682 RepID=A0ACC1RSA2_9APHY|nr:hypothetical protein NM688_g8469 [Phlebia brevispora]